MSRSWDLFLQDIVESAKRVCRYTQELDLESFVKNEPVPHASDDTFAYADASVAFRGDTTQSFFAAILEDERDCLGQAVPRFFL